MQEAGLDDGAEGGAAKTFKAVRFVSEEVFAALQRGEPTETPGPPTMRLDGALWLTDGERGRAPEERSSYWGVDVRPRVTLDRVSSSSQIYYAARLVFGAGAGWWLLVEYRDGASRPGFERLLALAGETGIGGERSSGHGHFAIAAAEPFTPVALRDPDGLVLLSLHHPTMADLNADLLGEGAGYELLSRRGWVTSPARAGQLSRSVRMLAEGSCLPAAPGPLWSR